MNAFSGRMRTTRYHLKRKHPDSDSKDSSKGTSRRPLKFSVNTEDDDTLTEEDFEEHKTKLIEEWGKTAKIKNKSRIVSLMKETLAMRRTENSRKYTERLLFNITTEYTFLKTGEYVSFN